MNRVCDSGLFSKRKEEIIGYLNRIIPIREQWIRKNRYYYNILLSYLKRVIPRDKRILQVKADTGFFLNGIKSSYALGIEENREYVSYLKREYPRIDFRFGIPEKLDIGEKFDYAISVNSIGLIVDVKKFLDELHNVFNDDSRVVIVYYNKLWEYILKLAEMIGLKISTPEQNWLSDEDIDNLLYLSDFQVIKRHSFILLPIYIPLISSLLNTLSKLPLIDKLCFVRSVVARPLPREAVSNYTCSVIIPCKNEENNIDELVKKMPQLGIHTEVIFVDDKSSDSTREKIKQAIADNSGMDIKLVDGPGICKADAVWRGFNSASGEILFILDADLSVQPQELVNFYAVIASKKGEFINGSRLVYPMESRAMKLLNIIGNKFFSLLFSYILSQNIKDTLCGTKVLFRKDFLDLRQFIGMWGAKDRWGDYELLFGASKINLKIMDLPVHYCQRYSGSSKMTDRLREGIAMLKMCLTAYKELKG